MQTWGGSNIGRELKSCVFVIVTIFLLTLVADSLLMESNPFYQEASALQREFEQNITILANDMQALELVFGEGDELEFIFAVDVKQDLPIDVWFVNYANYVRLVDGNEFLFFIDGSQQEIKQAQKVVTITQHDSYALVFANYNNQSVEVYLTYDINIYPEEEEEIPLWQEPYVMFPIGLIIGILVGLFAFRMVIRSKRGAPKTAAKAPLKKAKAKKPKKKATPTAVATPAKKKVEKLKKKEPVLTKKTTEKEIEEVESGEVKEKPKAVEKVPSARFCGHCGKPVQTRFCPYCGKEAGKA